MRVEKNMTVMPNIMGRSYLPSSSIVLELCFVIIEIVGGKRKRERKDAPEYCISPYPVDDVPGNRVDEDLGRRNIQA